MTYCVIAGRKDAVQYQTQDHLGPRRRDDGVTLIALYHFLVSLLFLAGTNALAIPGMILAIVAATERRPRSSAWL